MFCLALVALVPTSGCISATDGPGESSGSGGFAPGGSYGTGGTAPGGVPGAGATVATGGIQGTGGITAGTGGIATGGMQGTGGPTAGTGGIATGGMQGTGGAESTATRFRVFFLIGQSNMSGGAEPLPEDLVEDERIQVLGFDDCASSGRVTNEWDIASPPLHACYTAGFGPGDHFARTLIEHLPEGDTIGMIPSALPGAGMDVLRKGVRSSQRGDFFIPPDNHWLGAYDWMIARGRIAQNAGGEIAGILFHQGETDSSDPQWVSKVVEMVTDLRTDLGTGPIPFISGELLHGALTAKLVEIGSRLENASYVTTGDLTGRPNDPFHFDPPSVRILGARYGQAMARALGLNP